MRPGQIHCRPAEITVFSFLFLKLQLSEDWERRWLVRGMLIEDEMRQRTLWGRFPGGGVKSGCWGEERWCELSADTDVPLPVKMQPVPHHQWEGGTGLR